MLCDKTNAAPTATTTEAGGQANAVAASGESLAVMNQDAGMSVKISAMELTRESWVAIKEVASNRILGAGRFPPGATAGTVKLLRGTQAGGKYEALIYVDDGEKKYDLHADDLVLGVSAPFEAE